MNVLRVVFVIYIWQISTLKCIVSFYIEIYSVMFIYFYYPLSLLVGNQIIHHDHYKVLDDGSIWKFIMTLSQFIMKDVYENSLNHICYIWQTSTLKCIVSCNLLRTLLTVSSTGSNHYDPVNVHNEGSIWFCSGHVRVILSYMTEIYIEMYSLNSYTSSTPSCLFGIKVFFVITPEFLMKEVFESSLWFNLTS